MQKNPIFLCVAGLALLNCNRVTPDLPDPPVLCGEEGRVNDTFESLSECLNAEGLQKHLDALQGIATANGGNRAAGEPGYEASVQYVADLLVSAGYDVSIEPFPIFDFALLEIPLFTQVGATPTDFVFGQDFEIALFSAAGDIEELVAPVDLDLGPGNSSTSGCEPDDFLGFPAGHIALIQRGTCTFTTKVINAQDAGAAGVLIMNQGNNQNRVDAFSPSLDPAQGIEVPVFGISSPLGESLDAQIAGGDITLHLVAETSTKEIETFNVIAETLTGREDNVVVLGAHLDSVVAGPGINDNGSGSVALLEIALQLEGFSPVNKLRFAWWGAEELGLLGSNAYVASLPQEEKDKIALYLNFDMIGSTNFIRGIYDGDGDAFGLTGPSGSDVIEADLEEFFALVGAPTVPTAFDGRSDYLAFILEGIPSGGLFSGADGTKSAQEAKLFGGIGGAFHDPCYHQSCDTVENIDFALMEEMTKAIAFVTMRYAADTAGVNARAARETSGRPPMVQIGGCGGSAHLPTY